ncbi:MAG: DMT family transporter [Rhodospirillales bacterium]
MQMSARDWMLLLALSLLWGGSFFFTAVAVREVPLLTLVLCRVGIAAVALALYLRVRGAALPLTGPAVGAFFGMGLLNNLIPFSLLFWAQTEIASGLASIVNATTPIFSMLVAHFMLADERMAPNKVAGVLFGIGGVAVLIGGNALGGVDASTLGIVACLGAALSYGFASVFGRRFRTMGIPPDAGALGQLTATTVMMIPIALIADRPWTLPMPGTAALLATLGLALAATALAYLIYFRLLATAGAVNAVLVTLLIPPSAILLGTLILGEVLEGRHLIGMALIGVGLVAVDGRVFRKR